MCLNALNVQKLFITTCLEYIYIYIYVYIYINSVINNNNKQLN